MIQAEIKRLHSPDVYDLANYKPDSESDFGFLLQIIVGIKGVDSEESFDVIVCTPQWLTKHYSKNDIIFGEHHLMVFEYNYDKIKKKIAEYINGLKEDSWEALASKIGRIGKWEFRDYQDFPH